MKTNSKIPNLVVIAFLMVGMVTGVVLIQQRQLFRLSASGEMTPLDVRVTNVSDNSFTVSWYTEKNATGGIAYGETQRMGLTDSGDRELKRIHSISLSNLKENTTYYFDINSGGETYDNNGVPWSVTTGPTLPEPNYPQFVSGQILSSLGTPAAGVLVYIQVGGANQLSTMTSQNGSWIVPISRLRTQTFNKYFDITQEDTLLNIFIQGGPLGIASAQIYVDSANPTPQITLGNSYDFRSTGKNDATRTPSAKINLPEPTTPASRFNLN